MNKKGEKKKIEQGIIGSIIKNPEYLEYVHEAIDKDKLLVDNHSIYEQLLDLALYEKIDETELWLKLKRLGFDYQSYIVEAEKQGIGCLTLLQQYILIWDDLDRQIKTEKFLNVVLDKTKNLNQSQFDIAELKEDWEGFCSSLDVKINQE